MHFLGPGLGSRWSLPCCRRFHQLCGPKGHPGPASQQAPFPPPFSALHTCPTAWFHNHHGNNSGGGPSDGLVQQHQWARAHLRGQHCGRPDHVLVPCMRCLRLPVLGGRWLENLKDAQCVQWSDIQFRGTWLPGSFQWELRGWSGGRRGMLPVTQLYCSGPRR